MLTQIIPLVVFAAIGYFAFTRMKAMKGSAGGSYEAERARLAAEFAALRQPGENDAAFVGVGTGKTIGKNRQFYIALTNKRLLLNEVGSPQMLAYDRGAVGVSAKKAKWTTTGNMQTTTTYGYDVDVKLPSGESHALRLYAESPYDTGHAPAMSTFLREVGAA
ncbi:MAG: hypothetical protein ACAI38_19215 [Myxococcota bacterium]|nr:hypothetical protein [Myxococcota bacterium]